MLNWYIPSEYQRTRYQDLVREAEQRQLVHAVQAQRRHHLGRRARGLNWLGRQLVLWGWRLQGQRFGD